MLRVVAAQWMVVNSGDVLTHPHVKPNSSEFKDMLRFLWRALYQLVIPLGLPQGVKLFFRVNPCMERGFREERKKFDF